MIQHFGDDFVLPPAPPEPPRDDRLAYTILYSLLFLFVFPFMLTKLWVWIIPLLFAEAVQAGIIDETITFAFAFRSTAVLALIFVAVAFFWESGRKRKMIPGGEEPLA